jgi:hypothetical protein
MVEPTTGGCPGKTGLTNLGRQLLALTGELDPEDPRVRRSRILAVPPSRRSALGLLLGLQGLAAGRSKRACRDASQPLAVLSAVRTAAMAWPIPAGSHGLLLPLVRRQGAFNDRAWHAHKPHAGGQGAGRRPYARLVARGTLNCTTQQRRRLPFLNNMGCFVHFLVTVFSALETVGQGNGGQPLASRNSG